MFKVGDKVRAVEAYHYGPLVQGCEYTVVGYGKVRDTEGNPSLVLKEFPKHSYSGFFEFRFERPSDDFNISTATDQELADEYRRMHTERQPLFNELLSRGYKFFGPGGQVLKLNTEFTMSKTETVTITL